MVETNWADKEHCHHQIRYFITPRGYIGQIESACCSVVFVPQATAGYFDSGPSSAETAMDLSYIVCFNFSHNSANLG